VFVIELVFHWWVELAEWARLFGVHLQTAYRWLLDPAPVRPSSVSSGLGIKSLAMLSTGEVVANPRHLECAQRELRRLHRQAARRTGPDRRTRFQPSRRWLAADTRQRGVTPEPAWSGLYHRRW
jgi:hypothetical protein